MSERIEGAEARGSVPGGVWTGVEQTWPAAYWTGGVAERAAKTFQLHQERFQAFRAETMRLSGEALGRSGFQAGPPIVAEMVQTAAQRRLSRASSEAIEEARRIRARAEGLAATTPGLNLAQAAAEYAVDAAQRWLLTLDVLRQRGDGFIEHEAAGAPPVLIYDHTVVLDGADLPRPCNYVLLKISPPADAPPVHAWKRPYMIIDPRAGHGAGIGGFKFDSQVGVALHDGHPVYFVSFRPTPEPGQTLADVSHAEAAFLREVKRLHPAAPEPIVVGNCQGGWASAILAARNPDLVGPVLLNGAPMSYWAGRLGHEPMRYSGGLLGGALPALIAADLGGGLFDGAALVQNFESLNPGRTWFRKYYDLFTDPEGGAERFLEFEKWWGGFYLMNTEEIRWILENLFVGNRLPANEARLEVGRPIDLKAIRAPIIVFASHGDTITPPQQALNWIVDTYADETEIEIRGQRIIYMVHEEVGHLGIFVSSSVAKKEHSEVASTLKTIEALAPGLYEMVIEDAQGTGIQRRYTVDFKKRTFEDILRLDDGRADEAAFAAVARLSETLTEAYDATVRPAVQAVGATGIGSATRRLHPMRTQREVFATKTPGMTAVASLAEAAREARRPCAPDNPFLQAERVWADWVELSWNAWRDARAMANEAMFLALYANPVALAYGAPRARRRVRKDPQELRAAPEVVAALSAIRSGGLSEAVVRMLVLLADARGDVRRDRLERSSELLTKHPPFAALSAPERTALIHRQSLIAHFEPEAGAAALLDLLPDAADRQEALSMVGYVVGAEEEMEPKSRERLRSFHRLLAPLA